MYTGDFECESHLFSQNQSLKWTPSQTFLTDSPVGLWRYNIKCYLLIHFNILQHNAWYTWSCHWKCWSFQYELSKRLLWNMSMVSNKDTSGAVVFIINANSFHTCASVVTLNRQFYVGTDHINKAFQNKMFLLFKKFVLLYV